jgi:hypothetical protein
MFFEDKELIVDFKVDLLGLRMTLWCDFKTRDKRETTTASLFFIQTIQLLCYRNRRSGNIKIGHNVYENWWIIPIFANRENSETIPCNRKSMCKIMSIVISL